MNDDNLTVEVRRWFMKTGFPLELEAVSAFRKAGFGTDHSSIYVDPETDKGREIDLIAYSLDGTGIIQIFVVAECKSSPNPWIVLTDKENYSHLTYWSLGVMSAGALSTLMDSNLLSGSSITPLLKDLQSGGYAIRQAFSKDNDQAYVAAIAALKASTALALRPDLGALSLVFALPTIVVDSPIFECYPDQDGELQFRQVEVSEFMFTAMVPKRTKAVIRIVSRSALPRYSALCFDLAGRLKGELNYKVHEWVSSV